MENEVSNKIRLLLNELAILNQPERHEGKFIYQLDTLKRIKQLSSELYLLSDRSMFVGNSSMADRNLPQVEIATPKDIPVKVEIPVIAELTTEANEPLSPPIVEIPALQEEVAQAVQELPKLVEEIIEKIIEPKQVVETPPTPLEIPKTKHENPSIASKISLTRRFEYINNLFGGDAQAFAEFLSHLQSLPNPDAVMAAFDAMAEEKNWKRKSESASDLKQLLRKLL